MLNSVQINNLINLLRNINMADPSQLLPLKFGHSFQIRRLNWTDFNGAVDEKMPWSAHIYWTIQYQITDHKKGKISAQVHIGKRSWARQQKKCAHLLNHEQGHYLIGSLCVLQFLRRVDYKKKSSSELFEDMVAQTFERTIKEYLEIERVYDVETEHRLNFKMQEKWDKYIFDKLQFYHQIYDKKKHKFVKLSESPGKKS